MLSQESLSRDAGGAGNHPAPGCLPPALPLLSAKPLSPPCRRLTQAGLPASINICSGSGREDLTALADAGSSGLVPPLPGADVPPVPPMVPAAGVEHEGPAGGAAAASRRRGGPARGCPVLRQPGVRRGRRQPGQPGAAGGGRALAGAGPAGAALREHRQDAADGAELHLRGEHRPGEAGARRSQSRLRPRGRGPAALAVCPAGSAGAGHGASGPPRPPDPAVAAAAAVPRHPRPPLRPGEPLPAEAEGANREAGGAGGHPPGG